MTNKTITEEEYQARNKRLIAMGIKPVYNTLAEKRKAVRRLNKLAREEGYGKGIDQAIQEELKQ